MNLEILNLRSIKDFNGGAAVSISNEPQLTSCDPCVFSNYYIILGVVGAVCLALGGASGKGYGIFKRWYRNRNNPVSQPTTV